MRIACTDILVFLKIFKTLVLNHDLFKNSFKNISLKNKTPNPSENVLASFKNYFHDLDNLMDRQSSCW